MPTHRNRFPVSPDLIGPWDALLSWLQTQQKGATASPMQALRRAVQGAKQQAVNLNSRLELAADASALSLLEERVAALEAGTSTSISGDVTVFAETPDGTMNGSNTLFTLTVEPALCLLFLNGVYLTPGGVDYTLVEDSILYVSGKIPASTDSHFALGFSLL